VIGERRPSSELLGWSLDLDQAIYGRKLSLMRFFALHACMALNFGWLAAYSVTHARFYFLF